MNYTYFHSPVGPLLIAGDHGAILRIGFPLLVDGKAGPPEPPRAGWTEGIAGPISEAIRQLQEYFAARRTKFDLPLLPDGTAFQRSVWRLLEQIPYGETITYAELAKRVGNPKAARAVGSANGKNPIPIVIPCHRVINVGGGLGGFGGGLDTKRILLALEAKQAQV